MKFLKFFILVFTFNVSTSIWKGSPVDWLGTALVCQSSGLSIWIVFQQTASIAQLRLAALVQILVGLSAVIVFADRMDDYGHSWGDVVMLCCIAGGLAAIFESNTLEKLKNAGLRRSLSLGFIWPFSSSAFLARQSARLSDEDLMAAYQLSDHTQQAKHAITDELARRQIRPEIFRNWLPPQSEATLPPVFRAPIRKKTYKRMVRIHIFTTVIIRLMCAVIILFASLLVLAGVQHLIKTETFSAAALLLVLTKAIAAFFFFGILFLLPIHVFVLIGAVHGRRKCARILLLRPFGQKDLTRSLKKVVRSELGIYGYVYTLSDQNYRPNFLLEAMDDAAFSNIRNVLIPVFRSSRRIATVKNEKSFFRFAHFLLKSWDPAFSTLLRGGQAFNVRTADAWWKRCVDLLVWSSDVVVIDVSRVKTGTAWELNELSKRGLLENAVLIAEQSKDLRDFDHIIKELTNKAPLEVFRYSEKGRMLLSGQFKSLFEGRILNAVDSWSSPHAE